MGAGATTKIQKQIKNSSIYSSKKSTYTILSCYTSAIQVFFYPSS
jgi:hypothetical protein